MRDKMDRDQEMVELKALVVAAVEEEFAAYRQDSRGLALSKFTGVITALRPVIEGLTEDVGKVAN